MIPCDYVDFEENVELVYGIGKTPLIVDTSVDEKVCTYYSYQPDVLVFDAQAMVASWSAQYQKSYESSISTQQRVQDVDLYEVKLGLLETLRRSLVQAMKFGKMLVIRLGTSAPNFTKIFSDEALDIDNTKRGSAYFPLVVFERGGRLLHEPPSETSGKSNNGSLKVSNARDLTWAERLFREEDMRPHKNVSFCRDSFRVCLVSKLPITSVEEYLFNIKVHSTIPSTTTMTCIGTEKDIHTSSKESMLPDRDLFTIISVQHD